MTSTRGPMPDRPVVGFACLWGADPARTWSGTPWALRAALRATLPVVDVGPSPAALTRAALKVGSLRLERGRVVTPWRWGRAWEQVARRSVGRSIERLHPDVLLQVGDFGSFEIPAFLYQDLNYDVLRHHLELGEGAVPGFEGLRRSVIERRRERQRTVYERAAGVFAMSQWFADVLVHDSGVPREKVHVVGAGIHTPIPPRPRSPRELAARTRLLFVGRDFERKGGPQVVAATRLLREAGLPVTLTVAGPSSLPLAGDPPEWVDHRGDVTTAEVSQLLAASDLFVLPSRFEAFGIAFAEARAHGLPCIGRRAFAMPELITEGQTGALIESDDAQVLAEAIVRVLRDDSIHARCAAEAPEVAAHWSWDRVAADMAFVMGAATGG